MGNVNSLDEICPWCGEWTRYVIVRSHYECPRCHRPVLDCCDGEVADKEDD
jgi:hypothetical protein